MPVLDTLLLLLEAYGSLGADPGLSISGKYSRFCSTGVVVLELVENFPVFIVELFTDVGTELLVMASSLLIDGDKLPFSLGESNPLANKYGDANPPVEF